MAREAAIKVLMNVIVKNKNLSHSLEPYQTHEKKALISEFCYGICRYYYSLHPLLALLMDKPLKAKDKDLELVIILGLYQLKFMHLKPFAAVDETVKLAKTLNKVWAKGLINAILRRYLREGEVLEQKLSSDLSFEYAHPPWFIDRLNNAHLSVVDICEANNIKAPIYLRIDTTKISSAEYIDLLNEKEIKGSISPYLSSAIMLETKTDILDLPHFKNGTVFVQDLAAQFARTLLDLTDNQRILDACSAPGGKLTDILQVPFSYDKVIALDSSASRVKKIHENLKRLNQSATVVVGDALTPQAWWDGKAFDRILLDAPCSATGVIRRHPDIKLLRTELEIRNIVKVQKDILKSSWELLAPGGRLVYATCSIFPEENDKQIENFIYHNKNAKAIDFTLPLGEPRSVGWQLLPGVTDGFYYAILEKSV